MFLQILTPEHIAELEAKEKTSLEKQIAAGALNDHNKQEVAEKKLRQEEFLTNLTVTKNVTSALKAAKIGYRSYSTWRTSDSDFCKRLMEMYQGWTEGLHASAFAKAVGYVVEDPNKPGEPKTDLEGTVIRTGHDSNLARRLLDSTMPTLPKAESTDDPLGRVTVNIDFRALGVQPEVVVKQEAIEGEVVREELRDDSDP